MGVEHHSSKRMRREIAEVLTGAPTWITEDLVVNTLETWQPHYRERLTASGAIEILLSVGNFFDVLEQTDDEAVPGSCESVES